MAEVYVSEYLSGQAKNYSVLHHIILSSQNILKSTPVRTWS